MVQKTIKVELNLKINKNVAMEVAEAVLMRANPHQSMLVDKRLEEAGVNRDSLVRYFVEIGKAVADFWDNHDDMRHTTTLKPHELRGLYLPTIYGVIFSSIGNITIGNYQYVVKARDEDVPDKEFLIEFSAQLEALRDILRGDIGQIGNRNAQPQDMVMCCLLGEVADDNRTASYLIRDGRTVDAGMAGVSALLGLSLVTEAMRCMYTGVDEVNFRQWTDSVVEKGLINARVAVCGDQ